MHSQSVGLREAQVTSVDQSSTLNNLYARLATDGNLKTVSHTNCENGPIWFRMDFGQKYCFDSFKIYQSHLQEQGSRERLAGTEVFVIDADEGEQLCDIIELTRVREKLLLILECPTVLCGNSVELRIEKKNGCIHMREIESYRINCRRKSLFKRTDGIVVCTGNSSI